MKNTQQSAPGTDGLFRLTQPLLDWYTAHRRAFPWREQATPYRIWVSEIMLQQTRIEAALPFFDRFIATLPTVEALADADEEQLLKLWEGLGYYSRVRNLQKAACVIVRDFGGELPASYEQLRTLPGIGDYTAGAIASIAFGLPVPAVDGNVLRVTARLLNHDGDITRAPIKQMLREAVCSMQSNDAPGDFNQALMELGETVCLPNTTPLCEQCPLAGGCAGYMAGNPARLPVRTAKKERRIEQRTILVIIADGRVLLHRRKPHGLLAGMWELPGGEGWLDTEHVLELVASWGVPAPIQPPQQLTDARHIFSHVEWQLRGMRLDVPAFDAPSGFAWADARTLREDTALPSAFRAYASKLPQWLSALPKMSANAKEEEQS